MKGQNINKILKLKHSNNRKIQNKPIYYKDKVNKIFYKLTQEVNNVAKVFKEESNRPFLMKIILTNKDLLKDSIAKTLEKIKKRVKKQKITLLIKITVKIINTIINKTLS